MFKIGSLCLFALTFLAAPTFGDLLVREDFDYADNTALVGQDPPYGSIWTAHSGAGNKAIQVVGGQASLDQSGGSGEDVNTAFGTRSAAATTYARFDFFLPSGQTVDPDASGLYFAHFKDDGFGFRGRTGILSPTGAGDFALAINADNSNLGAGATWATDLNFDTVYRVVTSFDANTGASQLWVDPTNMGSTSIMHTGGSVGTLINSYAFRQSNDFTGTITVDNLVVADNFNQVLTGIPEPSSALIVGIGTIGMLVRRRKQQL